MVAQVHLRVGAEAAEGRQTRSDGVGRWQRWGGAQTRTRKERREVVPWHWCSLRCHHSHLQTKCKQIDFLLHYHWSWMNRIRERSFDLSKLKSHVPRIWTPGNVWLICRLLIILFHQTIWVPLWCKELFVTVWMHGMSQSNRNITGANLQSGTVDQLPLALAQRVACDSTDAQYVLIQQKWLWDQPAISDCRSLVNYCCNFDGVKSCHFYTLLQCCPLFKLVSENLHGQSFDLHSMELSSVCLSPAL